MKKLNYKLISLVIGLIAISGLAVYYVFATWAPPTAAPPGANVPAPINVSTTTQTFLGGKRLNFTTTTDVLSLGPGLGVDGVLRARSNLIVDGNVGIGTPGPTAALDLPASTAGRATARIRAGVAPTTPQPGDVWTTGNNLFFVLADGSVVNLIPPPPAPSSLSATAVASSQINLSWIDNSANETGFQIERCTGSACTNFALVHTTGPNVTSWSNTGLAARTLFRYRARAIIGLALVSTWSNTAEATTPAPPPPSYIIVPPPVLP